MKAMIMAAGVGSRLMPLTVDVPKPMISMANHPLMDNTVRLLKKNGFEEIICNLHYHADMISSYFGDGSPMGISMHYSKEDELMGTAGGVKLCEWFLNESFIIVSGDALTDIDLGALYREHKKKGALATIALKQVEEVQDFGVVITNAEGKIERFQEKPRPEEALSRMANTGIYVFEPEIFKYIPAKQFYDFGKQVFPSLVKSGAPFYGVEVDRYWCDIGNLDTYRQAHADILEKRVQMMGMPDITSLGEEGKVLIGKDVQIGANVLLRGNVVIGDRCRIEDNTLIENTVIWNDTCLKSGVTVKDSILGSHCTVEKNTLIASRSVLASGCSLAANTVIATGSRVFRSAGGDLQVEEG